MRHLNALQMIMGEGTLTQETTTRIAMGSCMVWTIFLDRIGMGPGNGLSW